MTCHATALNMAVARREGAGTLQGESCRKDCRKGAAEMGCFQESEPSIDEQFGLDVVQVNPFVREDEIHCALRLLREEEIAVFEEQNLEKRITATDTLQQILTLYDEFRPKLIRYMHKMYLNRDAAEEVIQEAFLRLTSELLNGSPIENVQGWIIRVAHNLAVDVIKRKERDAARLTDISTAEFETLVDPAAGPEEVFQREEQGKQMETALMTLNPQQRQCFDLRVQGFRYKDIGQALGISEQRAAIVVKQVAVRLAALCE
jgi:RNA polymerase sigma-70 factor, ECF subfamily